MKLKQIKEFNADTVTNEIAAQICAVGGLWNHYKEEKNKKFIITNELKNYNTNGDNSKDEPWGVSITSLITHHEFRIWKNGRLMCVNTHKKGEMKSHYTGDPEKGIPASTEYYTESDSKLEYPCDQVALTQLYLDLGFYTIES